MRAKDLKKRPYFDEALVHKTKPKHPAVQADTAMLWKISPDSHAKEIESEDVEMQGPEEKSKPESLADRIQFAKDLGLIDDSTDNVVNDFVRARIAAGDDITTLYNGATRIYTSSTSDLISLTAIRKTSMPSIPPVKGV